MSASCSLMSALGVPVAWAGQYSNRRAADGPGGAVEYAAYSGRAPLRRRPPSRPALAVRRLPADLLLRLRPDLLRGAVRGPSEDRPRADRGRVRHAVHDR